MPELKVSSFDLASPQPAEVLDAWLADAEEFLKHSWERDAGAWRGGKGRRTKKPERVAGVHWLLCLDQQLLAVTGKGLVKFFLQASDGLAGLSVAALSQLPSLWGGSVPFAGAGS